jgi:hypothetical protein
MMIATCDQRRAERHDDDDPTTTKAPIGALRSHRNPLDRGPVGPRRFFREAVVTAQAQQTSVTKDRPALILFGKDEAGKPRAAWFDASVSDAALKAAEALKLEFLAVDSPATLTLAESLTQGKLLMTGKHVVPPIKAELFDKLAARYTAAQAAGDRPAEVGGQAEAESSTENGRASASEDTGAVKPTAPAFPANWDQVGIGSLVLATVGLEDGWWEAIVEAVEGPLLTLRWRDFPREPAITRRLPQLALLHPGPR